MFHLASTSLLLRNGTVLCDGLLREDIHVLVENGNIVRVGADLENDAAEELDVRGHLVAPGFVDLHIHGVSGLLCESADPGAVRALSERLPSYGVTGFLPTLAAMPSDALRAAVTTIVSQRGQEPGARILGIHLEGPFLNPAAAGAQRADWMRQPDIAELEALQALAEGSIRLLTLAPELPGAVDLIAAARRLGIAVSLGHSQANAQQMRAAVAAGATHVTHLFNAMRGLHHREPGPIGVALTEDALSVELICDGYHVSPVAVELAWRCKPPGKVVAVTDAVALAAAEGSYNLFGVDCIVAAGAIRIAGSDTLAGSCLSLDQALRNLRAWLPALSTETLLACASANPAAVIGLDPTNGLVAGNPADLVILDADLAVVGTVGGGRVLHWRGESLSN